MGNNFKARAVELKPRERIEQAGTASVASGAELLAVMLYCRRDADAILNNQP